MNQSVLLSALLLSASANSYSSDINENMQRVGDLLIDRTEVSIGEFADFVQATGLSTSAEKAGGGLVYERGWERKAGWTWLTPFGKAADHQLPAVHITFDEAADYCRWAGKRIPTLIEWQRAAYTESRPQPDEPFEFGKTYPYPTGSNAEGANCLNDCGATKAIDYSAYLNRGIGPAVVASGKAGVNGLHDMGANVWEWTDIDNDADKGTSGGSWWYGSATMAREHRATKPRDTAAVYIGFRCVRDE